MSSTAVEFEAASAQPRVAATPAGRDLAPAIRRLALRRFMLSGLAFGMALGAAWYGHQWWTVGRFIESTDDAYVGGAVTVIAPKVAGLIAEVAVTDNQAVRAGDLLVKLDDRDYRAALAKATAAVAAQHAALANLDAARRLQESMIAQEEAEITAADAEVVGRTPSAIASSLLTNTLRCSASSRPTPTTRRPSLPPTRPAQPWRQRSVGST